MIYPADSSEPEHKAQKVGVGSISGNLYSFPKIIKIFSHSSAYEITQSVKTNHTRNFPGGLVAMTELLMLMTRVQFLVGGLDPTFYN